MFESFRDQDLKDTGSCDELGAGAPVVQRARGTTRESLIEGAKQKHTQREGLYDLRIRCRGAGHRPLTFGFYWPGLASRINTFQAQCIKKTLKSVLLCKDVH